MKPLRLLTLTAGAIALAAMLTGCNHKDLADPYGGTTQINLHYDWSRATGDPNPAAVDLYLYPGQGTPLVFNTPKEGGTLNLKPGSYPGFAYAPDSGSLVIKDTGDKDGCLVTTGDASLPGPAPVEGERTAASPDRAWYGKTDLSVPESKTPVDHTVFMEDMFVTFIVNVNDIQPVELLSGNGVLTGLAGGFYPSKGELAGEKVTVPFAFKPGDKENSVTAGFYAFGDYPDETSPNILGIYCSVPGSDEIKLVPIDVTDQVHAQHGQKVITINIDGLNLLTAIDWTGITMDPWKDGDTQNLIMN